VEVIQPRAVVDAARHAGESASEQVLRAVEFGAIVTFSAEFFAGRFSTHSCVRVLTLLQVSPRGLLKECAGNSR
jgi:hypothetical protein